MLEDKSLVFRLISLLFLMLGFGLLLELVAFGLVHIIYGVSPAELSIENALSSGGVNIRNAFRMLQFFLITGMFVVGPAVFVSMTKSSNLFAIGNRTSVDLRLALAVMLGILAFGWMVEGIVRLNLLAFDALLPSNWYDYLIHQSQDSAAQMAVFLTSESILEDFFTVIIIAFVPALAEEFLFRGVLQEEFKRSLNVQTSIFITALLFGLTHWQGLNFIGLVCFGWLLGWIKQTSQSLWFPILAHFTNNLFVLIQVRGSEMPIEDALNVNSITPLWQYALAIGLFIFATTLYFRRLRGLESNF